MTLTEERKTLETDDVLTPAETRVAAGYTCGLIAKEIAAKCDISPYTVVRHTQNIYDKTGIRRSTNALVSWYLSRNFNLDLSEFKRSLGAFCLFVLVSFQIATTDFDNQFVRRTATRRVEVRKTGRRSKRSREEDETYYLYD